MGGTGRHWACTSWCPGISPLAFKVYTTWPSTLGLVVTPPLTRRRQITRKPQSGLDWEDCFRHGTRPIATKPALRVGLRGQILKRHREELLM